MLRMLAVVALVAAACDQGASSPKGGGTAAGPAGEVVHIEGDVTAARPGQAPRALELGSAVHADDTISTPISSMVSIELAHNKVRWDVGGGQSYRVDQSRAWGAKGGSGSALDERDDLGTASAGRHGEREAGETQATARNEAREEASGETLAAATQAVPPTQKPEAIGGGSGGGGKARHRELRAESEAPPPKEVLRGKALGMTPEDKSMSESKSGPIAPGASATPTRRPLTVALGEIKVRGARAPADVASVFASYSAAACGVSETGAVVLRFEIGGDGAVLKPRVTGPQALVDQVKACVTAAARKLSFGATTAGNTFVEREIRFSAKSK